MIRSVRTLPRWLCLLAALSLVAACSDPADDTTDMGGEGEGEGEVDDLDEGEPQPYEAPMAVLMPPDTDVQPDPGCGAASISVLRGWVVDRIGRPLPGSKAQACIYRHPSNSLICLFPADTDENGVFEIDVPEDSQCASEVALRTLLPGVPRASMYCNLGVNDRADEGTGLSYDSPYVLYATLPPRDLPPIGDLNTSRTVTFEDGLELELAPVDFYGDYGALRTRRVATDERGLCFLEGQDTPDGLYAFYPEGTIDPDGSPVSVRIPNSDGLDPGSVVDLFVLGGLDCTVNGQHVEEASWAVFGSGTVTDDGAMIASDPGVRLPCLTWMGYKAR